MAVAPAVHSRPPRSAPPVRSGVVAWLLALAWLLVACPTPSTSAPEWPEQGGFDDHSVARVDSLAHFETLAATGGTRTSALKFVITRWADPADQALRFLDGQFYVFHDEWYWFRLYNGARVPGSRERPLSDQSFATVAEIADWVRARRGIPPFGMRFVDERLYSDHFYELAVRREQRSFGIGTIVHFAERTGERARPELWGFELEYSDTVDEAELERFFATLRAGLPAEIANPLMFVARSPNQERLVARMRARKHPLAAHLTSYAEIAIPGEVEVYNPGLIAGRLRRLPDDPEAAAKLLTEGDPRAIWMLPAIPDELPPAAGLLTAVPQTPLAHVNLLARNRGIPNVYLGGLLDDPQLDQLSRVHAPIVLLAEADGRLRLEPISEAAYTEWLGLARARVPVLDTVDVRALPYTLDLDSIAVEHVPLLRSTAGGKAAGFPILRAAGVTMPDRPLAITIRAYTEHLAELRPAIAQVLEDPEFRRDPRLRYLVLEGREEFDERFTSARDQAWVTKLVAAHPPTKTSTDAIALLLASDGIKRAIRERPLTPAVAQALDQALAAQFGQLAPTQGLRFRSSSTVEDVEGFSGAGLYDSNTGFLDAAAQADKGDRKHDAAWAIKKTWASYWSWEAFEERRMTGIDHLAGNMAVLVHPRFDDALELSNGVITLTLDRAGTDQRSAGTYASMEIDVQLGALSVTNPPPELAGRVLPEVVRATMDRPGAPVSVSRVAASTELPADRAAVLSDAQVEALMGDCVAIAERYLAVENRNLDPARQRRRVTLDLEIREVAEGWPATTTGPLAPSRMVIKQVRSLDPGIPPGAEGLLKERIPRELILFADRIELRNCRAGRTELELLEIWTDPMISPALGHEQVPYLAGVRLRTRAIPGGPVELELDHSKLVSVAHPGLDDRDDGESGERGDWGVRVRFEAGAQLDAFEFHAGLLDLRLGQQTLAREPAQCTSQVLFASPDGFLRGLLGG